MAEVVQPAFYGLFDMFMSLISIVVGLPLAVTVVLFVVLPIYHFGVWITTSLFRR